MRVDRPGNMSLKLMDDKGKSTLMALGKETSKSEIFGVTTIYDIADEFNKHYTQSNDKYLLALESSIEYDENIGVKSKRGCIC